jgi:P-type conjugative transfer protein TrbJ
VNWKRFTRALPLALVLFFVTRTSAQAQIPVTDLANLGVNIYSEIARYVQEAVSLINEAEGLYNQYTQIAYQIQALKKLNIRSWRDIGPLYHQLEGILNQAETLSYTLDNLEDQFNTTFPGVQKYLDYPTDVFRQTTRTLNTYRVALLGVHKTQEDNHGSLQTLGEIQNHVDAAQGQEQVLEALGELGSWQADQQAVMGATLQTIANVDVVKASYELNQEARLRESATDAVSTLVVAAYRDQNDGATFTVVPDWMPNS